MSRTSAPRTSPTTSRSGRIRKALRTRVVSGTSPTPSTFACRADSCTTCGWATASSRESSTMRRRWRSGAADSIAPSRTVLPEPVPPEMRRLARRETASAMRVTSGAGMNPSRTRSSRPKASGRGIRKLSTVTSPDSGGMTAFTRIPSGSRTSTSGEESSSLRPPEAASRTASARTSDSAPRLKGTGTRPSPKSAHTSRGPFTNTSVTPGRSSSGWSGPAPDSCAVSRATSSGSAAEPSTRPERRTAAATAASVRGPGWSRRSLRIWATRAGSTHAASRGSVDSGAGVECVADVDGVLIGPGTTDR